MRIREFLILSAMTMAVFTGVYGAEAVLPSGMELAAVPASDAEMTTGWRQGHCQRQGEKVAQAWAERDQIKIVFLGDSITHFWDTTGKPVFDREFAPYHTLNLGISGDRTQHLLWIVEKSEVWHLIQPQLIVMMIGTNNIGWKESGPEAIVAAVKRAIRGLQTREPQAKILLFAIFPRGNGPDDPYRIACEKANLKLAKLADGQTVFFASINDQLMNPDGTLPADLMPDKLHPALQGYEIWAKAILPYVQRFVKK